MKKVLLFLSLLILVALACDVTVNMAPTTVLTASATPLPTTEPPTTTPEIFISLTQAIPGIVITPDGVQIFVTPLSFVLSPNLASGASGSQVPPATGQDLAYWELTPGHTVIKLEGYILQDKFHEPKIYVYPATAYAELFPGAFESMHRLRNVMNQTEPVTADQLPAVPFFNASQNFASNFQTISFQNGSGLRFLTQYNQYAAPVNNTDMFYHFQGFTSDGEYYIIAVLPVTAPVLAETAGAEAVVPEGGIAYPKMGDPNSDFPTYYTAIANLLNSTLPDAFHPTLNQLDALIQSMLIQP